MASSMGQLALADVQVGFFADEAVALFLRRHDRAVAPPAEVFADLAQSRAGVATRQPHGNHPRFNQAARLVLRLEPGRFYAKHFANRRVARRPV